jgi:hypothetical protein
LLGYNKGGFAFSINKKLNSFKKAGLLFLQELKKEKKMEKIFCVGAQATLTKDQKNALERLVKYSDGLIGVQVFPNIDVSDHENIPTGIVMYFDPSATVDASVIHENLFETLNVSKVLKGPHIKNGVVDDATFTKISSDFCDSVRQHPQDAAHPKIRSDKMLELEPWTSELGGKGSFVGAFSQLDANHRDKTYYLAAKGTAPLIVQDLKQEIASRKPTFRELVSNKDWSTKLRNGQYIASRNVQRNIADAASASQVAIARIRDLGGKSPTPDHAYPLRAEPEWKQSSHSIRDAMWQGKPTVAIYSGVVPSTDRHASVNNDVFVAQNPYDGLTVFPIISSPKVDGFAVDTGRNVARKPHTEKNNARQIAARAADVVKWEEQKTHPLHPDVSPDAWNPIDEQFKNSMKQGGWSSDAGTRKLLPVVVKLYNPNMQRK